ncbi:MFS transporter [Streptomyces sp. NPDC088354]|uniref:MFS transporter n=1 Tax=unclassified Streptomyces TaxID=2593676 RepID=UPI0029B04A08|nr:MFS transporter [Streptomyces sp. MI02-7b]MDX3072723.1 MFS transporter [Streptomyces sp. MI02-7b]
MLRTPHAFRTFGAALLGRLSYGMVSLALMLAVKGSTGSYGTAGAVMALFGLTSVFLSPVRAALVDRHGPRRALTPMACAYALLLVVLAAATWRPGAPGLLLALTAVVAGSCTPPLGPVMRTVWGTLMPDHQLRQRAFSLDAVAEELLFVTGPLLVGLLVALATPAVAVAVSAALVLTGTFAFVSSPAIPAAAGHGTGSGAAEEAGESPAAGPAPRWKPGPELGQAIALTAGAGVCLGALDLLVVAVTERQHQPGAVAWILAALSAGSAVGGLAYGARSWRSPARKRLPILIVGMAIPLAAAGISPDPWSLAAVVTLAGLFVAPALSTAYLIADESAAAGTRNRAGAWVNTAINAGSASGTAAVGLVIGRLPLALCFALAVTPALASAITVWNRVRHPAPPARTAPEPLRTPTSAPE